MTARIAEAAQEHVRVHVPDAGGSFGLHYSSGANDPASEALHIARALDWRYPIKVQCSREEEFKSGRYRAMAVHRVRAGAHANGQLTAYHHQMAAQPTSPNLPFVGDVLFKDGVDFRQSAPSTTRTLDNFKLKPPTSTCSAHHGPRSVGNSHTASLARRVGSAASRDPATSARTAGE
jgi:isoquinoline 1-oxidoreductase beta subunit